MTYREYLASQIAIGLASTGTYPVAGYFAEKVVKMTDEIIAELVKKEK